MDLYYKLEMYKLQNLYKYFYHSLSPLSSHHLNKSMKLLNNLQNIEENNLDKNESRLTEMLLFDDSSFNNEKKHKYCKY